MKKKTLSVLAMWVLAISFLFTACGGKEEENYGSFPKNPIKNSRNQSDDGRGDNVNDTDTWEEAGVYIPTDSKSEWQYLEILEDGTFTLYGENADIGGWLEYDEEYNAVYAYEDAGTSCLFETVDDEKVYLAAYGYFERNGMDNVWFFEEESTESRTNGNGGKRLTEDDEPAPSGGGGKRLTEDDEPRDEYYDWNPELYQHDVAEFAGTWYYEGDPAAEMFIVIDEYGNWSYYQRAKGDAEATEMDYGTFRYSMEEGSVYYADSSLYDNVTYKLFEFDNGILVWGDDGVYELAE